MGAVTTLGPSDWVAALHDCDDVESAARGILSAALRHLPVDAACLHAHAHGRRPPRRLATWRRGAASPGSAGAELHLAPGELRSLPPRRLSPPYAGTVVLDLASSARGSAHLELYTVEPFDLSAHEPQVRTFGSVAGIALRRAAQVQDLRRALVTRTVIGQAQGVLMERYGIDGPAAMAYLRRASQDANCPVRTIAEEIVTTDGRPGQDLARTASWKT